MIAHHVLWFLTAAGMALMLRQRDRPGTPVVDLPDVWGRDSFPASDPPANW